MTLARKVIEVPLVPPWIAFALGEIGVLEAAGGGDNPRVVQYHAATAAGAAPDAVPWCSSFGNWCFLQAGIIGTRSKAARSWLKPPPGFALVATGEPQLGDVVILSRRDARNLKAAHFCFWLGPCGRKMFFGLGGNQQNAVGVGPYPRSRILAVVRYVGAAA